MQKEYMYKKVSTNFQITLPQKYCKQFKITPGSILKVNAENEKLVIQPSRDDKTVTLARLQSIFDELDAKTSFSVNEESLIDEVASEIKASRAK